MTQMQVKVLVVGDPHIKVNNVVETDMMMQKLKDICLERKPDFIVLLGDILDRHSSIHVVPLMKAENMILTLSQIAPTFVIIGNHDRPNNSNFLTDEHPFNALKLWPNTFIIDKVLTYTFKNMKFLFVPYVPAGRLEEAINTLPNALTDTIAVFQHSEIQGCNYNGIKSTSTDVWTKDKPLGVSGHIHDYEFLLPNFIIVGTPFQQTFAESPDKAISFFTFNEDRTWHQERIDLNIQKKITVYVNTDEFHSYTPPLDKKVKLIVKGDEASIKTISKTDKMKELKQNGVIVVVEANPTLQKLKNSSAPKLSYKSRLLMELGADEHAIKWFQKIFV